MTTPASFTRPSHPKLARVFDDALQRGHEIRYADETQVVVFSKNEWGCGGLIFLLIIGALTAFIVPLILLLLGALSKAGQVTTYTLTPAGKVKKKQRKAR